MFSCEFTKMLPLNEAFKSLDIYLGFSRLSKIFDAKKVTLQVMIL